MVKLQRLNASATALTINTLLLQGYAVKAGMLAGRGERLLFMDADGATRVSDVEKLEAALATISGKGKLQPSTVHWSKPQSSTGDVAAMSHCQCAWMLNIQLAYPLMLCTVY